MSNEEEIKNASQSYVQKYYGRYDKYDDNTYFNLIDDIFALLECHRKHVCFVSGKLTREENKGVKKKIASFSRKVSEHINDLEGIFADID